MLVLLSVCLLAEVPMKKAEEHVKVLVVERGPKSPLGDTIFVGFDSNGELYDIEGHPIVDEHLPLLLKGLKKEKGRTVYVDLVFSDEEKTTLSVLGRVLKRLTKSADTDAKTIIHVPLKELNKNSK